MINNATKRTKQKYILTNYITVLCTSIHIVDPNSGHSDSDSSSDSGSDSDDDDPVATPSKPGDATGSAREGYRLTTLFSQPYLFPRRGDVKSQLVRMHSLPLSAGEIWYFRLLLLHTAAYSHDEMKIVEGISYATYQEAAIARGLFTDVNECNIAFAEAQQVSSPPELRSLFIQMTSNGYSTINIYNDESMLTAMMEDYLITSPSRPHATNRLLIHMAQHLALDGRTLSDFGLPEPQQDNTLLDRAKLMYDKAEQNVLFNDLKAANPFTDEMDPLFEGIDSALTSGETIHINLQGKAGTGKTTFTMAIMAWARSLGHLVVGCASTALAASIYEDDWTTGKW
jgi:hypothetical protein